MLGNRLIVVALPLLALAVGFWLLAISPKQSESGELQDQIETLQSSIDSYEAEIAASEAAREEFPENYGELVTLGRAAPETSDQASFIYDVAGLGKRNDVKFRDFTVTASGGATAPPPPAPAPASEVDPEGEEPAPPPSATPAVATEATAATLPIGATVGPAGLPVMPYEFRFLGSFFDMASFFQDVDKRVTVGNGGEPKVKGRLVTIDSFELTGDPVDGFPSVEAKFNVTTYIVPPEEGLSAGATPAGPAPVGTPEAPTIVANTESAP
jgi:Tfp pilus assembly protein PilO